MVPGSPIHHPLHPPLSSDQLPGTTRAGLKTGAPGGKKTAEQRYGSANKLPKDEPVVAPSDLAESELLVEVPRVGKK